MPVAMTTNINHIYNYDKIENLFHTDLGDKN